MLHLVRLQPELGENAALLSVQLIEQFLHQFHLEQKLQSDDWFRNLEQ